MHDWIAPALIAVLVSAMAIPGPIPLLLIQAGFVALRVASMLQIGLLFFAGYWLVGVVIALLGTALVLLAVPLGG